MSFFAFKAIGNLPIQKPFRIMCGQHADDCAGVYGLLFKDSKCTKIKDGTSFDCFSWAKRQIPEFAFKMAGCRYLREIILPMLVKQIEDLCLL